VVIEAPARSRCCRGLPRSSLQVPRGSHRCAETPSCPECSRHRELDDIAVTAIFHLGQAANKDALGIQIVKALRRQRQPFESLQRLLASTIWV
jgi:hypothetical protein